MTILGVEPIFTQAQAVTFAVTLAALTTLTVVCSPARRRAMGWPRLALAIAVRDTPALASVIVVRAGFRLAYRAEGYDFWASAWRSLPWMIGAAVLGQAFVRFVPPTSWLLADLRRTNREIWRGRFNRLLGGGR